MEEVYCEQWGLVRVEGHLFLGYCKVLGEYMLWGYCRQVKVVLALCLD